MAELPPAGRRDFATKRDVDALRTELRGEMAELRGEMAEFRGEFKGALAQQLHTNIGCMLGFGGIVLAAVKLA
jgi:hypothetical protein